MTDLFNDDELVDEENIISSDVDKTISIQKTCQVSQGARKRLEDLLEQKRLKDELDDYAEL